MKKALWLLLLLAACDPEITTRPPTQIMLRVVATGSAAQAALLRVHVAARSGESWRTQDPQDIAITGKWPVDLPIVPGKGQSRESTFEVIAQAVTGETIHAEARVITNFVPGEQRLLNLQLSACGDRATCEANKDCHGTACRTCDYATYTCAKVPVVEGSSLNTLDPNDTDTSFVLGDDAGAQPDASDDAPDAGPDAESPGCPGEPSCEDSKTRVYCAGGVKTRETCDYVCSAGECTGVCEPDAKQCGTQDPLVPELCDAKGEWQPNLDAHPEGKCAFVCMDGACEGECNAPDTQCRDRFPQTCEDHKWVDGSECAHFCTQGGCPNPPSCAMLDKCGAEESCCSSDLIPGGKFLRGDTYFDPNVILTATLTPFRLDRFEVTVGRFRKWLAAYGTGFPEPGAGKGKHIMDDPGWDADWNAAMPANAEALGDAMEACSDHTWLDAEQESQEALPINCVTWYEAFAFCIWDGGRLPTEAEWNFAAAAGKEQRVYPWAESLDDPPLDATYAVYGSAMAPLEVGGREKGDGEWLSADLAGNVAEWALDHFASPYGMGPCNDCAEFQDMALGRVVRGGGWGLTEADLDSAARASAFPEERSGKVGFRCARDE
jgi:sulfatase modifying factor 1